MLSKEQAAYLKPGPINTKQEHRQASDDLPQNQSSWMKSENKGEAPCHTSSGTSPRGRVPETEILHSLEVLKVEHWFHTWGGLRHFSANAPTYRAAHKNTYRDIRWPYQARAGQSLMMSEYPLTPGWVPGALNRSALLSFSRQACHWPLYGKGPSEGKERTYYGFDQRAGFLPTHPAGTGPWPSLMPSGSLIWSWPISSSSGLFEISIVLRTSCPGFQWSKLPIIEPP